MDYINHGKEDQMEIYGYKKNKLFTVITWCLIIMTGGALGLIFHWVPKFMLFLTHSKCSLEKADTVLLIEQFQENHTKYYVKKITVITAKQIWDKYFKEDLAENITTPTTQEVKVDQDHTVRLFLSVHLSGGSFKTFQSIITFTCKKLIYIWDLEKNTFIKLQGLDEYVPTSIFHQMPGLSFQERCMRLGVYGRNEIIVPVKNVFRLVGLEILNPFYIFQLFSFCLWIIDDYYYYALVILIMSSCSIIMAALQSRRNQRNLHSTVSSSDIVTVYVDRVLGKITSIRSEKLVPGDVLIIPSHGCVMPCDAVLLTGNCILNESMLTGESVPVTKTPIPLSSEIIYDNKEHARHTLFCGTRILQTRYFGNEKVLAVVIRTGFNTSKGGLVRSIMYPVPADFKFEQDSYKFVILLACIASIGVIHTIVSKAIRGVKIGHIIIEALDLITIVIPPALPAAMTAGRLIAQNRLKKKNIYCTSPRAINVSGSIDCICFDKTGTLTEDGLDMWGVVPVSSKKFGVPIKNITHMPFDKIIIGMATCHGITIIDGQLVGDPLDLKMFESTAWSLEEPNVLDTSKFSMLFPTVVRPPTGSTLPYVSSTKINATQSEGDGAIFSDALDIESATNVRRFKLEIGIVRQFPFTSTLQRMSVITRTLGADHYDLYCKGSPEMIFSLSTPNSIPDNFNSVLEEYTSEGYRVIALAYKSLKRLPYAKVQRITREIAESDLSFLSFIILENRLKDETIPVIDALNDASIKVIMVTGDNILTALSVARDCNIVKLGVPVVAVNAIFPHNHSKPDIYFAKSETHQNSDRIISPGGLSEVMDVNSVLSIETAESAILSTSFPDTDAPYSHDKNYKSSNEYVFALTGKTWILLKQYYPDLIPKLITRGAVFARMSPEEKQQLIQELQAIGYCVAMIGDGANDCGALKAAHTGISLSDAESSVASPFTSRETNISCVLSVIREGRAALATSFGIFKYMAAYSLTQFISVILLYSIDSNLTDVEFLYIDLFIISIFAFFFGKTEAYDGPLVKFPPSSSLISVPPILSLTIQILIAALFQYLTLWHIRRMEWFVPFSSASNDKDDVGCMENYVIFIVSSLQYIILAVVFSKGYPYRKPLFTNQGLLLSFIFLSLFSSYLALCPVESLIDLFKLVLPDDFSFRFIPLCYGIANFITASIVEYFFIDYVIFKKFRYTLRDANKSSPKFISLERDLAQDHVWPPLGRKSLPQLVPNILVRQSTAEEKIKRQIVDMH